MNWKNRLTNYNFWISIFSAVLLILQALKIEFDISYVNEIFTAVLGLLVVIGIINDPTRTSVKSTESPKEEVSKDLKAKEKLKVETDQKLEEINEKVSEQSLPTNKENETYNGDYKNDLQIIITKITADIEEKFKQLNLEINQQKNKETSILNQPNNENGQHEDIVPAVAEIENPYFDL